MKAKMRNIWEIYGRNREGGGRKKKLIVATDNKNKSHNFLYLSLDFYLLCLDT